MSVLNTFEQWKSFLGKRVEQAKKTGMSEQTIEGLAYQLGDYLAAEINPKNTEERLLKELWEAGNEEEQRVLAGLMVRIVHDAK